MAKNRGKRDPVYVQLRNFKYGWLMNSRTFGQVGSQFQIKSAGDRIGVTFGANSPKPPVCTIVKATGNTSSFCDPRKVKALKEAGHLVQVFRRERGIKTSGKSITVYVDTPLGYKYAWNMHAPDVPEATKAGVKAATPGDRDLVWGSFPKPPRAFKRTEAGSFSTFCPPTEAAVTQAVANGFTVEGIRIQWGGSAATP